MTTIGANIFDAMLHMGEDWYTIKYEVNDAQTNSGYVIQNYQCNYDCNTWPFSIP